MANDAQAPTVRFGRRQSRGLLLGFSGPRLAALIAALAVFVPAVLLLGMWGVVFSAPVWASLVAAAFVRLGGQPAAEQAPTVTHWGVRVAARQTRYRARLASPRPAGTLALPGDAASLRFHADPVSGAVMVHDPYRRTLAAIARVTHPAYVLLAPDDQARRVAGWGRALAGLAATGSCAAVQVLESALPDPGRGIDGWWQAHGVHDDSWSARQYRTLLEGAAPAAAVHRSLITLVLDLKAAARAVRDAGGGIVGAAEVLRGDMIALAASLQAADLSCTGWLAPADLAVVIRQAYDPASVELTPDRPGATLHRAGPVAVDEHWDHLRHDTGYSTVLWISEWPRIEVTVQFLHSLVFLPGVRKSFSLIATPLDTATALRQIRREKVAYLTEAAQKARIGRIADAADDQEYADVLDRERALIAGHADLRFTGLLAITAPDRDGLAAAVSATARAAVQSGCETRPVVGQQAQAFAAAALPLGRAVH